MANRLLAWFDSRDRDLPWLLHRSRYRIWVSEIMLQQTQIATVVEYYPRFIERFPDVSRLAASPTEEVLRCWEGLGYYRRARQLHAAAQQIVEQHGGAFPENFDEVCALPGIGRYTASAILSIADDQRLPILEGNTIRLFARLMALKEDTQLASSQKKLWQLSERLLPKKRVGDFNQALMDFGREVCTARNPDCQACCLSAYCEASRQQLQCRLPVRGNKPEYTELREAIVLVSRRNRFLVRKCADGERWAGLWDFPRFDLPSRSSGASLELAIQKNTGLSVVVEPLNRTIKHAVTRYRIQLECFQATSVRGRLVKPGNFCWKTAPEVIGLPFSTTGRKFADFYLPI